MARNVSEANQGKPEGKPEGKPRGKSKRVNIELAEETHTKAKLIAVLTGAPLGKYFEKAIGEAVKRDKKLLEEVGKR